MNDDFVPDAIAQRDAVFEFFTGKDYNQVTSSTRSMLQHLYPGKSDRHPIDTKLAAQRLGVSQRTVQHWIRGDSKPRPATAKKIADRTRQTVTTKRGRAQMAKRAKAALPGKTRKVNVHGVQGISSDPTDMSYNRNGRSGQDLTPEEQEKLIDAWAEGGDTAALEYLTTIYQRPGEYHAEWRFHGVDGMNWL